MGTQLAQAEQSFTTRKLHPTFGLEISGLDVSKPLTAATVARIAAFSADHKLLMFKDQHLSADQLNAFAQYFGDTDQPPPAITANGRRERQHNVSRLGNQEDADKPHVEPTGYGLAARTWHTDSAWRPIPTWMTFLAAVELPDADGDTAFADMQAAYDALSDERKALLDGKSMVHNWRAMRRAVPSIPPMDDDVVPPVVTHPVVRTVNGRKGLFLNGLQAYYVGNMRFEEGEALCAELMAHATSAPFTYQHKWTVGDLAMWDDRTTMHRAMPYDTRQRRVMHRAEVMGTEPPT